MLQNIRNQNVLFSPLNWGWGHMSRAIPLLQKLQSQENEIHLACTAQQYAVLSEYLSDLTFKEWPGYPFRFKGNGNFGADILASTLGLFSFGRKEKNFVRSYVSENNISLVLSDHRYFFSNKEVKSIFITHQINLPLPRHLRFVQKMHERMMNRFSEIWIVDDPKINMAGHLSNPSKTIQIPYTYIGILSRFSGNEEQSDRKWTTVLVSGPEPYAQQFYQEQRNIFEHQEGNWCILYRGVCEEKESSQKMSWLDMDQRLRETQKLISRSGYSTLMDVHFLKCEVNYFPTPGQKEQEYLASIHV